MSDACLPWQTTWSQKPSWRERELTDSSQFRLEGWWLRYRSRPHVAAACALHTTNEEVWAELLSDHYPSEHAACRVPISLSVCQTCTKSGPRGITMSKDAASSSLPAPLRAIVGVLTLALRAVQLVVRRRHHATQHSPWHAHQKWHTVQVATGLIYFIFCQGTMLAKEQKLIKKVPAIVNEVRAGSTTRDGVPQL